MQATPARRSPELSRFSRRRLVRLDGLDQGRGSGSMSLEGPEANRWVSSSASARALRTMTKRVSTALRDQRDNGRPVSEDGALERSALEACRAALDQ